MANKPFLTHIKVGDTVRRMLAGTIPMDLTVTNITPDLITTGGGWTFCPKTGAEIDEDLGWGPNGTGSFLIEMPLSRAFAAALRSGVFHNHHTTEQPPCQHSYTPITRSSDGTAPYDMCPRCGHRVYPKPPGDTPT